VAAPGHDGQRQQGQATHRRPKSSGEKKRRGQQANKNIFAKNLFKGALPMT